MRQVPQSRSANSYGRLVEKGSHEGSRSRAVLGPTLDLMLMYVIGESVLTW